MRARRAIGQTGSAGAACGKAAHHPQRVGHVGDALLQNDRHDAPSDEREIGETPQPRPSSRMRKTRQRKGPPIEEDAFRRCAVRVLCPWPCLSDAHPQKGRARGYAASPPAVRSTPARSQTHTWPECGAPKRTNADVPPARTPGRRYRESPGSSSLPCRAAAVAVPCPSRETEVPWRAESPAAAAPGKNRSPPSTARRSHRAGC